MYRGRVPDAGDVVGDNEAWFLVDGGCYPTAGNKNMAAGCRPEGSESSHDVVQIDE